MAYYFGSFQLDSISGGLGIIFKSKDVSSPVVTPVVANVARKFRAYDPILYAATSSSYDTGTVALTSASGTWNFPAISVTGGGTSDAFPLIRLTNKTSTGSSTLTTACNSGTAYTTLSVVATTF